MFYYLYVVSLGKTQICYFKQTNNYDIYRNSLYYAYYELVECTIENNVQ